MALLEVSNLSKRFGHVLAVDSVSFTVERGEIISLLGPSGCGKTTTLRLIAGFEEPDSGQIQIDGQELTRKRPYERNVGLLFQNYALFPHMSVRENIAFGLKHRGWPKRKVNERVDEMVSLVKLEGMDSRYPAQLSGGQQQRVALARALATQPEVVLLDEPLSALDAKLRHELRIELKGILRTVGSTTIIVTHDQEEAMGMAERIIVLEHGRIQQEGTADQIYMSPCNRFVAQFIGRSNWLSGACTARGPELWRIECDHGISVAIAARHDSVSRHYDVGIRPERIEIIAGEATTARDETLLQGAIIDVASLGAERHVLVRLNTGKQILVIEKNLPPVRGLGQSVALRIRAADCIVLPHAE